MCRLNRAEFEVKVTQSKRDEVTLCVCVCVGILHSFCFILSHLIFMCIYICIIVDWKKQKKTIFFILCLANKSFHLDSKEAIIFFKKMDSSGSNYVFTSTPLKTIWTQLLLLGQRWALCFLWEMDGHRCLQGELTGMSVPCRKPAGIDAPFANLIRIRHRGPCAPCKKEIPLPLRSGFISMHM